MDEESILKRRVGGWRRLSELSDKAEAGFRRLDGAEVLEFVRLYRGASSDLAALSSQTSNDEVLEHLNSIVTRAYGLLYRSPTRAIGPVVAHAVSEGARVVRRNAWAVFLSLALFLGAAVFSFSVMRARPDLREHFVSPAMEPLYDEWKKGAHAPREGSENIAMTALYASNNPRAGILLNSVSLATFGTMTAWILWTNGAMVGSLAADMASVGKLGFLLTSIAPHGVSEIGGFLVSGAGGFVMAWALIRPGRRTRGDALRVAGKDALALLLTGLVMIGIAAPIEGFFSFNPAVPPAAKVAFAVLALAGWLAYFLGQGHRARPDDVSRSSP